MAVSINWESFLWVSLHLERYYLGSILAPLICGSYQGRSKNTPRRAFNEGTAASI